MNFLFFENNIKNNNRKQTSNKYVANIDKRIHFYYLCIDAGITLVLVKLPGKP